MASPSGPSPPEWMRACESSLADGARAHVREIQEKRSSHFSIFSIPRPKEGKGKSDKSKAVPPASPQVTEPILVEFRDKRRNREDEGKSDKFKWAFVYENQRGITMFSTAYYSSRSLLPHDPPPFTVPDVSETSHNQHPNHTPPNVTLTTYPLPDPTWRWVSKSWLVDMRGDGDVQHDGFEYNWFFRRHGWRPQAGWCGCGGYVRRRRWIRLMMRPSDARLQAEAAIEEGSREDEANRSETTREQLAGHTHIWKGDENDWNRVRKALMSLTGDGPKLDLWADWLRDLIGENIFSSAHLRETTEDDSTDKTPNTQTEPLADDVSRSQERPRWEWMLAVLREHGRELRSCFVYPDSRAHLREMLVMSGLLQNTVFGDPSSGPYMSSPPTRAPRSISTQLLGPGDFWSQGSGLNLAAFSADRFEQCRGAR
ncbi:hypothetical protein JB92DRAFT_2943863 [Gautieria morchelliformis]|nr:hypothetical protein JB92DRAFT_2943863 [Gautieria morchelliformis]